MSVRGEYDAMLRAKAAAADPGDPGAGDPAVSRVVYALRDLGVAGPAEAADVLDVCSHGLSGEQRQAVLAGMRPLAPVGPAGRPRGLVGPEHELHDEGRHDDPPGVSWAEH